ncbi:glycoside hydrolase family 43 protein [Arthrobacter sp. S39]|uniref:glycoside hydrolase family 43 protein n=1 Tax=Arthrobacter sp. S39 TaxID=2509720 RepID=UPI001F5F5C67|nr:glycoside hydrolase family 43 protein [Arthrobacter sp. S39]
MTGQNAMGEWLVHPVGAPLFVELLAQHGLEALQLGLGLGRPLIELGQLTNGRIPASAIDDMLQVATEKLVAESFGTPGEEGVFLPVPVRKEMTLDEIQIRDPFILSDSTTSTYYLYGSTDKNVWSGAGTGFDTYRSGDLVYWEGPFAAFRPPSAFWSRGMYWAPEVHEYQDHWYMFATFTALNGHRGTQVLIADHPLGPFEPWSDGPVTPHKWQCLDGTFFLDSGQPWIVYCHEWTQIHDGAMYAQRLSADLRCPEGAPVFLFSASDADWSRPMQGLPPSFIFPAHVTDGPSLFRLDNGHLMMLWSSFGEHGYAMGIAHSTSGNLEGPWIQEQDALWSEDGGHGMIFRPHDGGLALTLHQPNNTPHERATIWMLAEHERTVSLERRR